MTRHRTQRPARGGVATTELVMVLPLLVGLCMAALDLGRAIRYVMRLESAVRCAADYGATRGVLANNVEDVRMKMQELAHDEFAGASGVRDTPLSVQVEFDDLRETLPRIRVRAESSMVTTVNWGIVPRKVVLQRSFSVRRYR